MASGPMTSPDSRMQTWPQAGGPETVPIPARRHPVAPEVSVGQLPEARATYQAYDLLFLHRPARVTGENGKPTVWLISRGGRLEGRGRAGRLGPVHHHDVILPVLC